MREGMIPTVLGAAVTGAGAVMVKKKQVTAIGAGILGFGIAHIVLGSMDLVQHRDDKMENTKRFGLW